MFRAQFGGMAMNEEMEANMDVMANNYLQQNNGENYMNVFIISLRTEKILEILKQNAQVAVKKVTREEFDQERLIVK
jgi:trigger factor